MARAKRWTVPFMSLNGTSCRVDIYDEDWTGSVTTLTGAANAFEYEEDDDEDLLNGVLRYRTGYLRIVEETYGALDNLYPATNTDRYIEFYYGTNLDFVGFIMAQDFESEWAPGPRVIDLSVVSPLGHAGGIDIDWQDFLIDNTPSWRNLRYFIRKAFEALNGTYAGFYFPKMHSTEYNRFVMDELYLNTLTVVPFAGKYKKESSSLEGIYDAKTVGDLLTMICTGFGLILHDGIDYPVFQRVDWQGDYIQCGLLDQSAYTTEQGVTDMTSIAEVASAEGRKSVIQPMSKIEVTYDGDDGIPYMTMNRCHGSAKGSALSGWNICSNSPNIGDFSSGWNTDIYLNPAGLIEEGKIALAAVGKESLSEMILYRAATSWSGAKYLGSYTFFEWIGKSGRLQFKFKFGMSIDHLDNEPYQNVCPGIGVGIYHGSTQLVYSTFNNGSVDCELGFTYNYNGIPQPLRVLFYSTYHGNLWICSIGDVKIAPFETANDLYLERNYEPVEYKIEGSPSFTDGSLTRGFGLEAPTTNRLRYNGSITESGTITVQIKDNDPRYPYLTQKQNRLQIDVKTAAYQALPPWYMNRQTLWASNKKWRCIARSFRPWDDICHLTFHHSTIFDY